MDEDPDLIELDVVGLLDRRAAAVQPRVIVDWQVIVHFHAFPRRQSP